MSVENSGNPLAVEALPRTPLGAYDSLPNPLAVGRSRPPFQKPIVAVGLWPRFSAQSSALSASSRGPSGLTSSPEFFIPLHFCV